MDHIKRYCSICDHWGYLQQIEDGVVKRVCAIQQVKNKSLGMDPKYTKGSDVCGKWTKKKPKTYDNFY